MLQGGSELPLAGLELSCCSKRNVCPHLTLLVQISLRDSLSVCPRGKFVFPSIQGVFAAKSCCCFNWLWIISTKNKRVNEDISFIWGSLYEQLSLQIPQTPDWRKIFLAWNDYLKDFTGFFSALEWMGKFPKQYYQLGKRWISFQSNNLQKDCKNLPEALSCEFIQQTPITDGSDNNQNAAMIFSAKKEEFSNNWLNATGEKKIRNSLSAYMKPSACSRINLIPPQI